jgi:uncharacterized protein (DUF3084 family)
MAKPMTVSDLLAEQPEGSLRTMLHAAQAELKRAQDESARLEVEVQQIQQALAKQGRQTGGRSTLTRDQVLAAARATEPPFTAAEVQATLETAGHSATVNATRNHLNRLVEREELLRHDDGRYVAAFYAGAHEDAAPLSDDEIPF